MADQLDEIWTYGWTITVGVDLPPGTPVLVLDNGKRYVSLWGGWREIKDREEDINDKESEQLDKES